jgi:hypothetical protein
VRDDAFGTPKSEAVDSEATLKTFHSLFRGNSEAYTIHAPPFSSDEGKEKVKAAWCGFAQYGTKSFPVVPTGKEKGDCVPLTQDAYREHLNGGNGLAVTPVMHTAEASNVCYYAAVDIDAYGGADFRWLVKRMYDVGLRFAAFLSKSGGLHIYFLFVDPEPAEKAIAVLKRFVEMYGLSKLYVSANGISRVEIFPKSATLAPGSREVNGLFLPFYDSVKGSRQRLLAADGKRVGIFKALPIVESMLTSVKEIGATLDKLPYGDAPYCIQSILLNGALAETDGRNNFLFAVALYMKLAQKDGFERLLQEANGCLEEPLDEGEVHTIYASATSKDWPLPGWCKKEPLCSYCDKKLCKERTYGVGRGKNSYVTNVEFGKVVRMLAEKPYYLWEVRAEGMEEYKRIRIDDEDDFFNQRVVQRACIRHLNTVMSTMKQSAWEEKIAPYVDRIEDVEIPKGTDTTEMSTLRRLFTRYLTHSPAHYSAPHGLLSGQVYRADGCSYFDAEGFKTFLSLERFSLRGVNLREQLKDYGCSEGKVEYKTANGALREILCWKKPDDPELLEMAASYEDIYDGDADIVRNNKLNKDEKETDNGDDAKF